MPPTEEEEATGIMVKNFGATLRAGYTHRLSAAAPKPAWPGESGPAPSPEEEEHVVAAAAVVVAAAVVALVVAVVVAVAVVADWCYTSTGGIDPDRGDYVGKERNVAG